MLKKIVLLIIIGFCLFINTPAALAEVEANEPCGPNPLAADPNESCIKDYCCKLNEHASPNDPRTANLYYCQLDPVCATFGQIQAPGPLGALLSKDPTGAGAISTFLSNLINLFYSIAAVVALFMFLWAAFEWMTSGGDKEKVAAARNKIIYTIIGIVLLALAFAILRVFGQFTGFTFFKGP